MAEPCKGTISMGCGRMSWARERPAQAKQINPATPARQMSKLRGLKLIFAGKHSSNNDPVKVHFDLVSAAGCVLAPVFTTERLKAKSQT
jgi:hypothetical protein